DPACAGASTSSNSLPVLSNSATLLRFACITRMRSFGNRSMPPMLLPLWLVAKLLSCLPDVSRYTHCPVRVRQTICPFRDRYAACTPPGTLLIVYLLAGAIPLDDRAVEGGDERIAVG